MKRCYLQKKNCIHSYSLVLSLAVIRHHSLSFFVTRCHSLSLFVIRCHLLYHSLSLVVIRCTTRCHSLSLIVIRCTTCCHLLSFVVTRCTTRLSVYKRSTKNTETINLEDMYDSASVNCSFINTIIWKTTDNVYFIMCDF